MSQSLGTIACGRKVADTPRSVLEAGFSSCGTVLDEYTFGRVSLRRRDGASWHVRRRFTKKNDEEVSDLLCV